MTDTEQSQARIESFEKMLSNGQDSSMLRYTLGSTYWKVGSLDKALEHLRSAVSQQSDYSAAWKTLGRVLFDDEQFTAAVAAYDNGLVAAASNGDKQNEKEINVFRKRALKRAEESADKPL